MTDVKMAGIRDALEALPDATSHGDAPLLANVYFPQSHLKALHPDVAVVKGMRGAGKTFWWAALQEERIRDQIGKRHERTEVSGQTALRTGFGFRAAIDEYPSKDVFLHLLHRGVDARMVWRTVQARQIAPKGHALRRQQDWSVRVKHVQDNPETIDRMFAKRDCELQRTGRYFVVVYDALDRSADDWRTMYAIIRGLVQTALDMRAYRRLRVKMFLRTDQFDPTAIGDFPDASKVLSSAADLRWPRHELYGLLWHLLFNGKHALQVRTLIHQVQSNIPLAADGDGPCPLPPPLAFDEKQQRRLFHAIAGEWMGQGPRRGFPYTWIPNHLGDTEGNVSPRSFVAALKAAAQHTRERHPDHEYALHYDSIKSGVQKASEIRVAELREDYPWADRLLRDLEGFAVPCRFQTIEERWRERKTLTRLRDDMEQHDVKLPPSRIDEGAGGVRENLESLSVFQRMHDGRVNIPDVVRVGYGLGRRGGVRPVR